MRIPGIDCRPPDLRRHVVWPVVENEQRDEGFAIKLLGWKHSGFSIDNSVRILDREAQTSLAEYISRPPISLKKIRAPKVPTARFCEIRSFNSGAVPRSRTTPIPPTPKPALRRIRP